MDFFVFRNDSALFKTCNETRILEFKNDWWYINKDTIWKENSNKLSRTVKHGELKNCHLVFLANNQNIYASETSRHLFPFLPHPNNYSYKE